MVLLMLMFIYKVYVSLYLFINFFIIDIKIKYNWC